MKKAIIYARTKATVSDFGLPALDTQFQTCKEYAERHNIQIVGLYSDIVTLGYKPKYLNWRAIVNIKKPNYDYIIISDFSRAGRNLPQRLKECAKLKERGVRIISATESTTADEDNLMFTILEAMREIK